MRTTFGEIRLFNDDLFHHERSFIFNRKEWAKEMEEREREKKSLRDGEWLKRAAAWDEP